MILTKPVLSIVATAVLDDNHGEVVAGVPDPVSFVVPAPIQTLKTPVIVGLSIIIVAVEFSVAVESATSFTLTNL
jgi:hypothetical protein